MATAIYPGTFDPVTYGHLDILNRSKELFDEVIIAIAADSHNKVPLFTLNERKELLLEATKDIANVSVRVFEGLTVNFARQCGAAAIIRGLRAVSDFDYEFQIALMNKKIAQDIETVFLMTQSDYSYISSSAIKLVASLQVDLVNFVPPHVEKVLMDKYAELRLRSNDES